MKKEFIDTLLDDGRPLTRTFYTRNVGYSIGTFKITERQFDAAIKRHDGKLKLTQDHSGFGKHHYHLIKTTTPC
jgi:hypothetical protein